MRTVTTGTGLTSIGDYAFVYCNDLYSVILGNNLTSIGTGVFYDATVYVDSNSQTLFTLWCNGYNRIKDVNTQTMLWAPKLQGSAASGSSVGILVTNYYPQFAYKVIVDGKPYPYSGTEVRACGLHPNQSVNISLEVSSGAYSYSFAVQSFKTDALTLETQQPKVISEGNVIVSAISNLDDEEQNVGFEWRRQDWPDDFDSKTGGAYLYEGQMEGYIRSLNANYLWKFRPYYEANDGTRYYGEWKGMDPSDYSYFEPTVHTYASVSVNGNMAQVRGYAQRGTDNITSQGFMYWKATASANGEAQFAPSVPRDAQKVEATGTVMEAELKDLDYETEYHYVAFVTTSEGETFYGEEKTFHTGEDLTPVEGVEAESVPVLPVAYYNMQGRRIPRPERGINIVRMGDGTVRKVLVK